MNTFFIIFFSMSIGVVAGFFVASMFAVGHINDLHDHYRRKNEQNKDH